MHGSFFKLNNVCLEEVHTCSCIDLLLTANLFKSDVYGSLSSVSIKSRKDKSDLALLRLGKQRNQDPIISHQSGYRPDFHLSQEPLTLF